MEGWRLLTSNSSTDPEVGKKTFANKNLPRLRKLNPALSITRKRPWLELTLFTEGDCRHTKVGDCLRSPSKLGALLGIVLDPLICPLAFVPLHFTL